ncbi:MAG: hypothetical protein ACRDFQ_08130 [Anaerolineales bacterium]
MAKLLSSLPAAKGIRAWVRRQGNRIYWMVPLGAFLLGFVGRTLFYYHGIYIPPRVPTDEVARVEINLQPPQDSSMAAAAFSGTVVIDTAHINNFRPAELTLLFGRITAAGGQVQYHRSGSLSEALRGARAYVVISNVSAFDAEDVTAVESFVRDGGRLLIVGDPTRLSDTFSLNSLAGRFGIVYQDDYIYNLVDNDGSYLNVYLRNIEDSPLSEGVREIVVRAAHSLRASEGIIVSGDENTFSSLRETAGGVAAVALTTGGSVLALPDLTFLTPPYNTFADNDRFIDNVVTFLLSGQPEFELLDFPHVFGNAAQIVVLDSELLSEAFQDISALRQLLDGSGVETSLDDSLFEDEASIILGTYDTLDARTQNLLLDDGVRLLSFRDVLVIPDAGELSRVGTTLFHLHRAENGAYELIILGDGVETLRDGLRILLEGRLEECRLHPNTALCVPQILATPTPTQRFSDTPTPTIEGTPDVEGTPTPTPTETPGG